MMQKNINYDFAFADYFSNKIAKGILRTEFGV